MKLVLSLQNPNKLKHIPQKNHFTEWVEAALKDKVTQAELTIRIVDETESRYLNHNYRHKDKPTNVISFPFEPMGNKSRHQLGDIVMCAEVVAKEAKADEKDTFAHWAHLTIHGVLHLLGYDHEVPDEAEKMEKQEIEILEKLGFSNPYL